MRFLIHTYGCQMNVRDSESVEALMIAAGHEKVGREEDAELVLINSCTVRQKAEEKAIGKAGNLIADGKTVGMMGCVVARLGADGVKRKLPKLAFAVKPGELDRIPYVGKGDPLAAHNPQGFRAFVTVMTGCDNCCSYCIVPKTRGHEYSRPADEILREIECLAKRGIREVTLLGQSVLRYRGFPQLLRRVQEIDGIERIRFTSAHPKGCTDELISVYRDCPKVCRHLHLPVQSGSDRVLGEMGRRYTRGEYLAAVRKLYDFDPEFSLTTDVIVGYPGETEADFEATRTLMEEAGFDNAFVFKYSPRPGTRSAALPDDVPTAEKERRDQVLLADQEARGQRRNERLIGTVREVLAEGPSKRNPDRWSGRDGGNRIVVWDRVPGEEVRTGEIVKVRVTAAHPQILLGEVVRDAPAPRPRIGIYGGSFDPVHYGHLNVARSAIAELKLDRLVVVPANVSPFKTERGETAASRRPVYEWAGHLELVRCVFAAVEKCEVDDRELRRGGVSYAIDTVAEIAAENPGAELFFVIGEDSVAGLPRWKDYDRLQRLCKFVPFPRTKESSTEIRELFSNAKVALNPESKLVEVVKAGLVRKGGFCPCRLPKNPEFFCPCDEFKAQMRDPNYHGLCHCRLYLKP